MSLLKSLSFLNSLDNEMLSTTSIHLPMQPQFPPKHHRYYNYRKQRPQKEEHLFVYVVYYDLNKHSCSFLSGFHSHERIWVSNDGFNDVLRDLGIISALIAELTHAGCRELPLSALQTPREETEELPPGGLFFTAKRMHDRQSA